MAKDYLRIAAKIRESNWLITEEGLDLICSIVDRRMRGDKLTDEEIAVQLEMVNSHGSDVATRGTVEGGIGVLPIYGPIFGKANMMTEMSGATSLESFRKDFASMLGDPSIKSIILDIDSPGGTSEMVATTGKEIFDAREIKPVVALANGMAGSAAYWLASQAQEFYMTPDGSVGSIGAYTVHEDQSAMDAKQGIKYTYISAGPYKTEGNPHEPLSREGEEYRQEVINELYDEFVSVVASGRGVTTEKVTSDFGGGRMLLAKKALAAGMVDGEREFSDLVSHMAAQPAHSVRIAVDGHKVAMAVLGNDGIYNLSSVDWEHSEPGTGNPPTPRPNESDRGDTGSGSRRPDLPNNFPNNEQGTEGAPKASNVNDGGNMNLEQLMQLFNVDSEEALFSAITAMHTEQSALQADVSLAGQEARFQKDYPAMYEQMMNDRKINQENAADKFVESHKRFAKAEGEGFTPTNIGLSALAADTVRETYLKFATGKASLADFEGCINAITHGGTLEYGERGSSGENDGEVLVFSTETASGIAKNRQLFAAKVAEVQAKDNLEYKVALVEAAKQYPELAEAYRATAAVS